jgi:uncharacterized membrane protein
VDNGDVRNLNRLIALSDGIFAIAMTLLILDVRVAPGLDAEEFRSALGDALPSLGAYALSFTILGAFWRDHRRILQRARRLDPFTMRLTLMGLGAIAVVPFPTSMLAEYAAQPQAVAVYAGTVVVIDLLQLALFLSLWRRPELSHPVPDHAAWGIVLDLGVTVLVFAATVPIAFHSPTAALWSWLALVPLKTLIGRRERAAARRARDG